MSDVRDIIAAYKTATQKYDAAAKQVAASGIAELTEQKNQIEQALLDQLQEGWPYDYDEENQIVKVQTARGVYSLALVKHGYPPPKSYTGFSFGAFKVPDFAKYAVVILGTYLATAGFPSWITDYIPNPLDWVKKPDTPVVVVEGDVEKAGLKFGQFLVTKLGSISVTSGNDIQSGAKTLDQVKEAQKNRILELFKGADTDAADKPFRDLYNAIIPEGADTSTLTPEQIKKSSELFVRYGNGLKALGGASK